MIGSLLRFDQKKKKWPCCERRGLSRHHVFHFTVSVPSPQQRAHGHAAGFVTMQAGIYHCCVTTRPPCLQRQWCACMFVKFAHAMGCKPLLVLVSIAEDAVMTAAMAVPILHFLRFEGDTTAVECTLPNDTALYGIFFDCITGARLCNRPPHLIMVFWELLFGTCTPPHTPCPPVLIINQGMCSWKGLSTILSPTVLHLEGLFSDSLKGECGWMGEILSCHSFGHGSERVRLTFVQRRLRGDWQSSLVCRWCRHNGKGNTNVVCCARYRQ